MNTATKGELEAEGIGSVASQAIIDYRTRNGPFRSAEEVRSVISDAIAAKMHIGISISGPATAKSAAPKEKSADAKAASTPDAKGPSATGNGKPVEKSGAKDDQSPDNVRERTRKDQDDRKT